MDFGKIIEARALDRIEWSLPSLETPEAQAQLERLHAASLKLKLLNTQPQKIQLGLPVWGESSWVGNLYATGTKSENFLREYAKQFLTVEVNSTFYALPSRETISHWRESVPRGFQFCPKFPQSVSREIQHSINEKELESFVLTVQGFEQKLGPCFLQFPPSLSIESLPRLNALFLKIPKFLKTMVEFRHPSFFIERRLKPEVIELLAKHAMGTVVLDTALYRDYSHGSFSATRVLVRFLGSDLHLSDWTRLDQWAERICDWYQAGMQDIYFFIHQPDQVSSAKTGDYLIRKLNEALERKGILFRVPNLILRAEEQGSLF
jgi:uncharacterized protein YecE (DUF72 family)